MQKCARICSECSSPMNEGYIIDNGEDFYCKESCLEKNMTKEEFIELYDNGNSDTFWTSWSKDDYHQHV